MFLAKIGPKDVPTVVTGCSYQRSISREESPIADETVGMDKGKVKPLGGAKRASGNKQQGNGAELDDEWQVVQEEELQVRITCKCMKVEIVAFCDTTPQMY